MDRAEAIDYDSSVLVASVSYRDEPGFKLHMRSTTVRAAFLLLFALSLIPTSARGDREFERAAALWDRGSFDSVAASLDAHFAKHGREVGAADVRQYTLKSAGLFGRVKNERWSAGTPVPGETDNVRRFVRADLYIDLYKTDSGARYIISFGRR